MTTKTLRRRFFSLAGRLHPLGPPPHFALPQGWPWETQLLAIASPAIGQIIATSRALRRQGRPAPLPGWCTTLNLETP